MYLFIFYLFTFVFYVQQKVLDLFTSYTIQCFATKCKEQESVNLSNLLQQFQSTLYENVWDVLMYVTNEASHWHVILPSLIKLAFALFDTTCKPYKGQLKQTKIERGKQKTYRLNIGLFRLDMKFIISSCLFV
jgi:hypothetical protein